MSWQDIVLTLTSVAFCVSLMPQAIQGFREKRGPITLQTSIPTFIGLYITSAVYFSLSFYFATVTCFITGTIWLILFIQRVIYKK